MLTCFQLVRNTAPPSRCSTSGPSVWDDDDLPPLEEVEGAADEASESRGDSRYFDFEHTGDSEPSGSCKKVVLHELKATQLLVGRNRRPIPPARDVSPPGVMRLRNKLRKHCAKSVQFGEFYSNFFADDGTEEKLQNTSG